MYSLHLFVTIFKSEGQWREKKIFSSLTTFWWIQLWQWQHTNTFRLLIHHWLDILLKYNNTRSQWTISRCLTGNFDDVIWGSHFRENALFSNCEIKWNTLIFSKDSYMEICHLPWLFSELQMAAILDPEWGSNFIFTSRL